MTERVKEMVDAIKARAPVAWRAAHPRNIQPPQGYCNPRYYAAQTVGNLMVWNYEEMHELSHANCYLTALALVANRVPTYFIAYEFAQAVANTDLPGDFKFAEIKWPMEAQLFVLPDQFVAQYYGCYAPFLAISHSPAGNMPEVYWGRLPEIEIRYPEMKTGFERIVIEAPMFPANDLGVSLNASYPMSAGIEATLDAPFVDSTFYEEQKHGFAYEAAHQLSPEQDKVFLAKAVQLAIKLVLAVACRPAAVEHGQRTRPEVIKRGRVVQRELWSPNIIGRTYHIPRATNVASAGPHSKPRFTFRRGHYAWQAKRYKELEFVSVDQMPRQADGAIDFDAAGPVLADKFRAVHERIWIEGILFAAEESANVDESKARANQAPTSWPTAGSD
jgi:hypothetical protein